MGCYTICKILTIFLKLVLLASLPEMDLACLAELVPLILTACVIAVNVHHLILAYIAILVIHAVFSSN